MQIDFYKNKSSFCKDTPGIDILLSASTIRNIFDWFNKEISANDVKQKVLDANLYQRIIDGKKINDKRNKMNTERIKEIQ